MEKAIISTLKMANFGIINHGRLEVVLFTVDSLRASVDITIIEFGIWRNLFESSNRVRQP